jgi:hypothetical protein
MLRFAEEGTDFGIACSLQEEISTPNFWGGVKDSPLWLLFFWMVTLESWQWFWNLPWPVL